MQDLTPYVLRGGVRPNYETASVEAACAELAKAGLPQRLMIDLSHGNTPGGFRNQLVSGATVAEEIAAGDQRIFGVAAESHLVEGRQDLRSGIPLVYGQSITDPCLGWEDSLDLLDRLAEAVRSRRQVLGSSGQAPPG